jgi:hypothetical protein
MPKPHRNTYLFQRKAPRLRVNLRIRHYTLNRAAPGAPLAFKNSFERCRVTQTFRITRPQHQHFQEQRSKPDRRPQ